MDDKDGNGLQVETLVNFIQAPFSEIPSKKCYDGLSSSEKFSRVLRVLSS